MSARPKPITHWLIRNDSLVSAESGVPVYWSNTLGWVPYGLCSKFSEDEKALIGDIRTTKMPLGGRWVKETSIPVMRFAMPVGAPVLPFSKR